MRRTMIALAIVLGVAVVDVNAQEHGAKAEAHGAKAEAGHEAPAKPAPATKPEATKKPEAAASAAEALAGNFARSGPDLVALAERIHKRIAEVTSESKGKAAAGQAGKSGESRGEASVVSRQSRVQLEWRVPTITWPEELLQPDAPSTH